MITQNELKALITYDKDSGNFYRVNTNKLIQVKPDRDGHIRFRVKNIIDAEKAVNAFREKHHGAFANHGK